MVVENGVNKRVTYQLSRVVNKSSWLAIFVWCLGVSKQPTNWLTHAFQVSTKNGPKVYKLYTINKLMFEYTLTKLHS